MTLASRRLPSGWQCFRLRYRFRLQIYDIENLQIDLIQSSSKFVKVPQSSPRNALIYRRINLFLWVR